ncbi:(Fe-S)-binding protein [Sporolactobacillus sp. THM7-7]|nr:(Fe-S)-binding protein [Sporolactobacillus sp. THM7-7]
MLFTINLVFFLLLTGCSLFLFVYLIYCRVRFIRFGKVGELETDHVKQGIKQFLTNVIGQKKVLNDRRSGIMHVVLFYGFIVIQFGAIDVIYQGLRPGAHLPLGAFYPYFVLSQEITMAAVIIAAIYAWYRRNIERLSRLKRTWKANLIIYLILLLMFSEYMSIGANIAWLGQPEASVNFSAQPVSAAIASGLAPLGSEQSAVIFYLFWWLHLLTLLFFLVYIPQSKHTHLLFGPVNWLVKDKRRSGKPSTLDIEAAIEEGVEAFGVGKIEDFSRNQLIDLYACVECGRCTNVCPASLSGETLSPMHVITKLRDHLTEKGAVVTHLTPWVPHGLFGGTAADGRQEQSNEVAAAVEGTAALDTAGNQRMVGDIISEEELWACTTCMNCVDQCPVGNEHVTDIIDMRRYLVMTEGKVPKNARRTLMNIERQGNPWGLSRRDRLNWREGMEDVVPTVHEAAQFEYLFFVGAMGAYDKTSIKTARAFARIMHRAHVNFAVLGTEENDSGDTARRIGDEMLFQTLAGKNIAAFHRYHVKKIVTMDPHAYNVIKNEYPDLGLKGVEVYHHTELLAQWLDSGRIRPRHPLHERVVYHDPCYLGRYNKVFEAPRRLLQSIDGIELAEMDRNRKNSMCCGAGGGMMWMDEKKEKRARINVMRTEQALAKQPSVIMTACPYCHTMLSDGLKQKNADEQVQALDIVELLEQAL